MVRVCVCVCYLRNKNLPSIFVFHVIHEEHKTRNVIYKEWHLYYTFVSFMHNERKMKQYEAKKKKEKKSQTHTFLYI